MLIKLDRVSNVLINILECFCVKPVIHWFQTLQFSAWNTMRIGIKNAWYWRIGEMIGVDRYSVNLIAISHSQSLDLIVILLIWFQYEMLLIWLNKRYYNPLNWMKRFCLRYIWSLLYGYKDSLLIWIMCFAHLIM